MDNWHNIYITDCTGKKFFNTNASPMSTMSEIRNLKRHLDAIKSGKLAYARVGIDKDTAVLMFDDTPYQSMDDILDDDLLNDLMS
jgi:uncharacterized protein YqgV (UPF0045/DUF77 family)